MLYAAANYGGQCFLLCPVVLLALVLYDFCSLTLFQEFSGLTLWRIQMAAICYIATLCSLVFSLIRMAWLYVIAKCLPKPAFRRLPSANPT
jgi:hypothetical protein